MKLIFERSRPGRKLSLLPACDVPVYTLPVRRRENPKLPELSENEIMRHYRELARASFSPSDGFCPMGSCTMKYNPQIDEQAAALPGFTEVHPLQPPHTTVGCREAEELLRGYLCEYTGMDGVTLQPAAGSHGEFTGLLAIRSWLRAKGEARRTKILVPDSSHGTNPASASMAGFETVTIPSDPRGLVDLDALRQAAGPDTAGLMLTNPNTLGVFDPNIQEITAIIHEAGGLCYYDGANLNAVLGVARPGDMGFDVMHINLHKTFAAPHGGGGPGSGPVAYKAFLKPHIPARVMAFRGNFLVELKALTYMLTIGGDGAYPVAANAALNARYMMCKLKDLYDMATDTCMHEFVISAARLKKEYGVTAKDIVKSLFDRGMHAPNMYFPLIVEEALMVEPSETESRETLDYAIESLREIYAQAQRDPAPLRAAPVTTPVGRPDEVKAARHPVVRYEFHN